MYDDAGVIPPSMSDCPAGSQPNEAYGTSGLNWRGAACRRRPRTGPDRAHPDGEGRDRGGGQYRAAGHAGPAPAQPGPAPAAGELDIHS